MRTANDLADRWHRPDGLLRYAYAPRFVPSCSDELLTAVAKEARSRGCLLHTHASENRDEVALVRELTGRDNIHHLHEQGLSGGDVVLAHCIHLSQSEMELLALTRTRVAHCPSSNQKLASGLCSVPELLSRGIHVSLAADGAPCNNRLDAFAEMRLAALLQSTRLGAGALPAPIVLRMATASGAEALGFPGGVLAVGKVADLVVLDPDRIWSGGDPASTVVYTMDSRSVRQTWVHGRKVAEDGKVLAWDNTETAALCHASLGRVRARAGL
jgi:5-methylthioadenosine/S-adenosylhomocysteine deaminase